MPKIVRAGGLNLTDDVVRIRDMGPPLKQKARPKPEPEANEEELDLAPGEMGEEDGQTLADEVDEFAPQEYEPGGAAMDMGGGAGFDASSGRAMREEIIQGAMAEAGRILEDAVKNAEGKKDEYLAQAQQEAEQLRQQAAEEGRREGFAQVTGEVKEAAGQLENAIARFEGDRAGFEAEYEQQLKWLAIEIASKVLAKKVADDDTEMLEMVEKAVQSVKNEPWIRVEVAQEMVGLIDSLGAVYAGQGNIEVSAIPAPAGTVQIETPSGVMDASLKTQLENLREYFLSGQGG